MFQVLHLCQCCITVKNLRELVTNSIMCMIKIREIVSYRTHVGVGQIRFNNELPIRTKKLA